MEYIEINIVFSLYIIALSAVTSGLTISILKNRMPEGECSDSKLTENSKFFYALMFLFTMLCFLLFFYENSYLKLYTNNYRIVNILTGLLIPSSCLWLKIEAGICEEKKVNLLDVFQKGLCIFCIPYSLFRLVPALLSYQSFPNPLAKIALWVDILLVVIFLVLSIFHMTGSLKLKKNLLCVFTMFVVTADIAWHYLFFSQMSFTKTALILVFSFFTKPVSIFLLILANILLIPFTIKYIFPGDKVTKPNAKDTVTKIVDSHENIFNAVKERYALTDRETELCAMIFDGKSNAEIAEELYISESTVKTHIYNLYKKTKVKSRMEIVCLVREQI